MNIKFSETIEYDYGALAPEKFEAALFGIKDLMLDDTDSLEYEIYSGGAAHFPWVEISFEDDEEGLSEGDILEYKAFVKLVAERVRKAIVGLGGEVR